MKHLLVPCDFSEEAQEAIKFATSIARMDQSKITILYIMDIPTVIDPVTGTPFYLDRHLSESLEAAAKEKYEILRTKHGKGLANIDLAIDSGAVAQTITRYGIEHSVDMVIMGTKGATGFKEFFIGSNTEKVVRFSPVPVFAIRKAVDTSLIKTIVHPTSLELNQTEFMNKLKALQSTFRAQLHLLYINTPRSFMTDDDIHEFISFYQLEDVTYSLHRAPTEQDGIMEFANNHQPDVLAMATHSRRGLSHLFSGSITEDVVNRIACPVWTSAMEKTENSETRQKEQQAMEERTKRHRAEL